ncbi:MAG: glycine cleavage system protein GcvH, partial [Candidatus Tectomicrobia bacterium]|nr:glycine cleavage system protein GcvH [Candidatus Tectomicrobia bacterium]
DELKYTKEHEWARIDGTRVVVGITDFAQDELGDVVFVELPDIGREVEAEGAFGVVESVKAVSDLFSPISGTIVDVNSALEDKPELVNDSPYGDGWMIVIEASNSAELGGLLSAADYQTYIQQESS